jgi:hypothetical protein
MLSHLAVPIHPMGAKMNLTRYLKIHSKWDKSGVFGLKWMKKWLKQPVFTPKVGHLLICLVLTGPATRNPG